MQLALSAGKGEQANQTVLPLPLIGCIESVAGIFFLRFKTRFRRSFLPKEVLFVLSSCLRGQKDPRLNKVITLSPIRKSKIDS